MKSDAPVGRKITLCPIGTLVSYRSIDGTCRTVENQRHAWLPDGTCGNCDITRKKAGYSIQLTTTGVIE